MILRGTGLGDPITGTDLDGRVAPQLGSLLAGFSILIENKKRRGEMALYVATRALCATVDEILPRWLRRRIIVNRWVSIWVERISFSVSIGIITCAVSSFPPSSTRKLHAPFSVKKMMMPIRSGSIKENKF
jgi:hypothetical protein